MKRESAKTVSRIISSREVSAKLKDVWSIQEITAKNAQISTIWLKENANSKIV